MEFEVFDGFIDHGRWITQEIKNSIILKQLLSSLDFSNINNQKSINNEESNIYGTDVTFSMHYNICTNFANR
jgi:hypothetical protein